MTFRSRDIENVLTSKGFIVENNHHKSFQYYIDGKKTTFYTYISHGNNEIGSSLISMMSKQLQLSKSDTLDLFNCPLSKERLLEIYREKLNKLV